MPKVKPYMKGYYVNLDNRTDRKEAFLAQDTPIKWERVPGIKTNPGWDGCRDAHLNALSMLSGISVVVEDDCQFLQPWGKLEKAMEQLPPDWDMLYLGASLRREIKRYSENLYVLKGGYSNIGIVYNCNKPEPVTEYILKRRDEIVRMDVFKVQKVQPRFKCFLIDPLFAWPYQGYSDIEHRDIDHGLFQKERFLRYAKD